MIELVGIRALCMMKMAPVVILAKYYLSARSAVSERPNLNARLIFEPSVLQSRQAYNPACNVMA